MSRIESNMYRVFKGVYDAYEAISGEDIRIYVDKEWIRIAEHKGNAMVDQWRQMPEEKQKELVTELMDKLRKYDTGSVREIDRKIANGEILVSASDSKITGSENVESMTGYSIQWKTNTKVTI